MWRQQNSWTCSVCSITWVLQATWNIDPARNQYDTRYAVGLSMGYPNCVNETYGCMSTRCVERTFEEYGLRVRSRFCTFDEAYAIAEQTTGTINPNGMYHFMALRGVSGSNIWVANSAQGYRGVYETMNRDQFNSLGPVELVYLVND